MPQTTSFWLKLDFSRVLAVSLPAIEGKTCSHITAENLNVANDAFIQTEASENIQNGLRLKIRTSSDIKYFPRYLVYRTTEIAFQHFFWGLNYLLHLEIASAGYSVVSIVCKIYFDFTKKHITKRS